MFITDDIKYVGVNDKEIDLFEGQYEVPLGMSYNSYVILDDMCCVLDSVDRRFSREWLDSSRASALPCELKDLFPLPSVCYSLQDSAL